MSAALPRRMSPTFSLFPQGGHTWCSPLKGATGTKGKGALAQSPLAHRCASRFPCALRPPTGALPRNRLTCSATGSASPVSPLTPTRNMGDATVPHTPSGPKKGNYDSPSPAARRRRNPQGRSAALTKRRRNLAPLFIAAALRASPKISVLGRAGGGGANRFSGSWATPFAYAGGPRSAQSRPPCLRHECASSPQAA